MFLYDGSHICNLSIVYFSSAFIIAFCSSMGYVNTLSPPKDNKYYWGEPERNLPDIYIVIMNIISAA